MKQVAELVGAREAPGPPQPASGNPERRDREDHGRRTERERSPAGARRSARTPQEDDHDHGRGRDPGGTAETQDGEQRREADGERQDAAKLTVAPESDRHECGDEHHDDGGRELLDSSPERVAVEQRRLPAAEGDQRAQPRRANDTDGQLVEAAGQQCRQARQIRLPQPRGVLRDELPAHAEREQRAERVAVREARRQRRLVRRRWEPGRLVAVLHRAIEHREIRRGVVELDVPAERRVPREDERRGEDGEDADRRRDPPSADPAPPGKGEPDPGDRERNDERSRERRRAPSDDRELRGQDDDRETERQEQR